MLHRPFLLPTIFTLLLSACASNPPSYLPTGKTPMVNIEAEINESVEVEAKTERLSITNKTMNTVNMAYKLFWYNNEGVTQTLDEPKTWQTLWLEPQQQRQILLEKPTTESMNYRLYLRGER